MANELAILPPVDELVAKDVLDQIDSLVMWHRSTSEKAETAGVRLSRLIATAAANTYWIVRGYKGEEEFITATFQHHRSYYYRLKAVGTELDQYPVQLLESIGISKCYDLVRIKKHCGGVIPGNFFIHAKEEQRDEFRRRIQTYLGKALPALAGDENDEGIWVRYRIWKSAMPIYNRAMQLAKLESGSESDSNAFINILAEFNAGHNEDGARLRDSNQFNIDMIGYHIETLNPAKDPTVYDRALGRIRKAFERLKQTYDE